jgi:hypothetical protein
MQGQSVSKIENQKPARFLYSYLSFGLDICLLSQIVFTKNAASCSFTTTPVVLDVEKLSMLQDESKFIFFTVLGRLCQQTQAQGIFRSIA